jgi:hypothetical protein
MKLLRHIIGVILGIIVFVFVYGLTTLIIRFIGMKDLRTIQRHFPLQKGGYISAATLARQLCEGARK